MQSKHKKKECTVAIKDPQKTQNRQANQSEKKYGTENLPNPRVEGGAKKGSVEPFRVYIKNLR